MLHEWPEPISVTCPCFVLFFLSLLPRVDVIVQCYLCS